MNFQKLTCLTGFYRSVLAGLSLFLALFLLLAFPAFSDSIRENIEHATGRTGALIKLDTLKTHSRLTLSIDASVVSKTETTDGGFSITLKGLSLAELGAPLGREQEWADVHARTADDRLQNLAFSETQDGVVVRGAWRFPGGTAALDRPKMETFEYRDRDSSGTARLVMDFWHKASPTRIEAQKARQKTDKIQARKKAEDAALARVETRKKLETKRADERDLMRFCREPLTDETDVFLPFQPFHEKVDFSRWFSGTTPDSEFTYFLPDSNDREAQMVRLSHKFYTQSKLGLVTRTIEFFEKEFPKSPYRVEMRFLRANALLKLGFTGESERILMALMMERDKENRPSPVALHSSIFLGARLVQNGSYLQALETFLWLGQHYPEHRLAWVFHLGAAESLFYLRQSERAQKEYQWVMEHAPDRASRAEAALRMGDLYLIRYQYEQALAAYYEAMTQYPEEFKSAPSIEINRAETLYGLNQFEKASAAFQDFLKRHAGHPAGWRATFRLGEIEGRKQPATQATLAHARKWFYESVNRFPMTPGATLARLRLASCGDRGGFDWLSAEQFFNVDAIQFSGYGEVSMARYSDLRALSYVRTLVGLEEYEQAIDTAITEIGKARDSHVRGILGTLLSKVFRKTLLDYLAEGKLYDAIKLYHTRAESIPLEAELSEQDYLLKLSQAASQLGLGKLAADLAVDYQKWTEKRSTRKLAAKEELEVLETGEIAEIDRKLKKSEQSWTHAKALWVARMEHLNTRTELKDAPAKGATKNTKSLALEEAVEKKLRLLLGQVNDESPFSAEKEMLLSMIAFRQGDVVSARAHAARLKILMPKDLTTMHWYAKLEAKAGNIEIATLLFEEIDETLGSPGYKPARPVTWESLGAPGLPNKAGVALELAELYERQKKWSLAAKAYERTLSETPGTASNTVKYGLANAYLQLDFVPGNRERGLKLLKEVADPKSTDFWRKLASERLENEILAENTSQPSQGGP